MKLTDAYMFVGKLKAYYPRYYTKLTDNEINMLAESWTELTEDITIDIMLICLKRHASTNKWPPTIADIRQDFTNMTGNNAIDEGQAWLLAKKYQKRNYFGPGVVVEEKDNTDIPHEIQQVVKQIGFEAMMMSDNENVMRSNFLNIYKTIKQRIKIDNQVPKFLKSSEIKKLLPEQQQHLEQKQLSTTKIETKIKTKQVDFNKNISFLQQARKKMLARTI